MKYFPVVALAALLSGCAASSPSPQQRASAEYGPEPVNYQEIIRDFMGRQLKDPESARYEFSSAPVKAWYGGMGKYGWGVCAHINAKNSYGGYTGARKSYFLIRDGFVSESAHSGELGSYSEVAVYDLCAAL